MVSTWSRGGGLRPCEVAHRFHDHFENFHTAFGLKTSFLFSARASVGNFSERGLLGSGIVLLRFIVQPCYEGSGQPLVRKGDLVISRVFPDRFDDI